MLKNKKLFDGYAENANHAIESVNRFCQIKGIDVVYDIKLHDGLEETEESIDGWQDCISIVKNGRVIANYLTCDGVGDWADGFCECAQLMLK